MGTTDNDRRRRRIVRLVQRHVLNPPMKALTRAGLMRGHVLIETRGRRSGKRRRNVVLMHRDGDTGWIIAEQGRHAGYVRNLQADPDVRIRHGRRWHTARAELTTVSVDLAPPAKDDPRAPSGEVSAS